jgi:predicted dienelactone hydrolase
MHARCTFALPVARFLALLLAPCIAALAGDAQAGVGLRLLEAREPVTGTTVPVAVFYPATAAADDAFTQLGPNRLDAQRDAAPDAGAKPLIVVSHGHGGQLWGHADLAEGLARSGYVVATLEHAGDSWQDQSGVGTDRTLRGRAYQASAAITAALSDPELAAIIDAGRIGAAGFSAGGYTTLLLLGAKPDFGRWPAYCARHPSDPEICAADLPKRVEVLRDPPPMRDPRVKAGFAMAPLGIFFGEDAFDDVDAPVFLYEAENDEVLLPRENSEPVRRGLKTLHGFRRVPKAGHYVFLAPCDAAFAARMPRLCRDPEGVDRKAVHAQVLRDARQFFDRTLRAPAPSKGGMP